MADLINTGVESENVPNGEACEVFVRLEISGGSPDRWQGSLG